MLLLKVRATRELELRAFLPHEWEMRLAMEMG